jgi:hypothetical protein
MMNDSDQERSGDSSMNELLGEMFGLVDDFFAHIDELFAHRNSRLMWNVTSYGRAMGLGALGHQCFFVETLRDIARSEDSAHLSSLVARHLQET